jgi:SOS response regulatory protein OraA/RecX
LDSDGIQYFFEDTKDKEKLKSFFIKKGVSKDIINSILNKILYNF